MDQLLKMHRNDQEKIFKEAAARSADIKFPTIIEKDFWVCWTLEQLFAIPEIRPHITFKGGTSLSKCYNIINRFSEDCDLTLSKHFLDIAVDPVVALAMSSKKKGMLKDKISNAVTLKATNFILPLLRETISKKLTGYFNESEWSLEVDTEDNQNLLFYYPTRFERSTAEHYIKSAVKLEFGARGDTNPNQQKEITPYIYNILNDVFEKSPAITVQTLTAERTFWEKITILHAEHHRPDINQPKDRIFRHYYDIVMLDQRGITKQALKDISLLETVTANKKTYFYVAWANYETAKIGSLRLLPNHIHMEHIKQDCTRMTEMYFGKAPDFDEIMLKLQSIERTINNIE